MKGGLGAWRIGGGAVALVLIGGGVLLGVQPALSAAAADDQAASEAATRTHTLQVTLAGLARTAAKQSEFEQEQRRLLKSVPSKLKPNTFVRRVNEIAALDDVQVDEVTPSDGEAYAPPPAASAAAAAAAAASLAATTATTAPTPAATDAAAVAAAPPAPVLAATDPTITGANLTVIPVTVVAHGTADALLAFTHDLQNDERLFLVSGYSAAADGEDASKAAATLTGLVYALKR